MEDLEIEKLTEQEIVEFANRLNSADLSVRRNRKAIRYQLYRLQRESETDGRVSVDVESKFKAVYASQELFDGWKNFSITWDVALEEPTRIVHRDKSALSEWEAIIDAKYPIIEPGGNIKYPDSSVKRKVEEHQKEVALNNIEK